MKENTLKGKEWPIFKESPTICAKDGAPANYEIGQKETLTNSTQRAAICIHISVTEIDRKISLKRQIAECKEFIKRQGWTSSDMFLSTPKNNIFCLIRARAKSGTFDKIITPTNVLCKPPFAHKPALRFMAVWDVCNFLSQEHVPETRVGDSNE